MKRYTVSRMLVETLEVEAVDEEDAIRQCQEMEDFTTCSEMADCQWNAFTDEELDAVADGYAAPKGATRS